MTTTHLSDLAGVLMAAKRDKAALEDGLRSATAAVETAESALFDAMAEAELTKISADGHTFSLDTKTYYSVPADAMDDFHRVMERAGLGAIFRFSVHHQTLNATLREMASAHDGELPQDVAALVTAYDRGKVNVRAAAKGR